MNEENEVVIENMFLALCHSNFGREVFTKMEWAHTMT